MVFLQGSTVQCASSVLAGAPGRVATDGGTHGAGPESVEAATSMGSARVVSSAFRMPGSPVVTLPADGTQQVGPRPRIEGRTEPGVEHVLLLLDGALLTRVVPDAEGRFSYDVPSELSPGSHEVRAVAELLGVHSAGSEASRFVVSPLPPELEPLEPLEPLALQVGCGCGSASGVGLWAGTLLLAAWAARRRSR